MRTCPIPCAAGPPNEAPSSPEPASTPSTPSSTISPPASADAHARPDPPRPVGVEPRKSLHRLVGRGPDRQGRGGSAARGGADGGEGARFRPLLHQPPDPRDQDARPGAGGDGAAVASGREGL